MNTEPIETTALDPLPIARLKDEVGIMKADPVHPSAFNHQPSPVDAAQARVDAVANVLHKAYENASMLHLSPDEESALTADFDDADFRTGAAGKENLIYIEHASLRQRLNKVIGIGQWSLVARNRWTEPFQYYDKDTKSYQEASRVYVETVLIIRGCFVAESVGDMTYYPRNNSTNFGDAVEGATSAALRRCAKGLGVGLQAWKKDFCEGWFKRRQNGGSMNYEGRSMKANPSTFTPQPSSLSDEGGKPTIAQKHAQVFGEPPKTPPLARQSPAEAAVASQPPGAPETPEARRERFLALFRPYASAADEVFRSHQLVLPTDDACDIDDVKIGAMSVANVKALLEEVKQVYGGKAPPILSEGDAPLPDDLHDPADYKIPHPDSEPWRQLIVPFGKNKGTKLGDLAKGSLRFYVCDWEPKPHEFKGRMYQPKESDVAFHKMLQRHAREIIERYGFDREGITP